jgi:glycosyltransferase involved in cell wall biosynthesis
VRVCLIGVTHFCHNPRLIREADSLAEAGHYVRVITPSFSADLDEKDKRHLGRRRWRHQSINYIPSNLSGTTRSIFIRGRRKLAFEAYQRVGGNRLGEYGYATTLPEQKWQASLERADWFIAHAQAALPIAAAAARRWCARLGFDCEDLLTENGTDPIDIVQQIEKTYLPRCDYISAASVGIATRLVRDYGVEPPVVLYNVFPLHLANGLLPPAQRPERRTLRLLWFSQTIGPGRGIEEAIEAVGMLDNGVELHLRGSPSRGYDNVLRDLAQHRRVDLRLHPQIDHDDLIRTMDQFDVGLALERPEKVNAALTVSNKIGSYLLAGLAIAATETPGQLELMRQCAGSGFLYPPGNPQFLAEGLRRWLRDSGALKRSQQVAWEVARGRFCWDMEQQKWLARLVAKSTN